MVIRETRETPVSRKCDVLVCGGGFGGIAAALAAARLGKDVVLLEKEYMLGGLGTAGLVTIYLPLCDGMGRQVSFGIAEELLRLSVSMGHEGEWPANWMESDDPAGRTEKDPRFLVRYNPQLFAMLAEKLLLQEGVDILYGTYAVAVHREEDRIGAVMIENKSGRQAIVPDAVVDATGDCDIAWFAGAPTERFQQGNLLAAWYYACADKGYELHTLGACDIPDDQKTGDNEVEKLSNKRFTGLDGEEISRMMQLSHRETMQDLLKLRETQPNAVPATIASIPQIRMTRRIDGAYTLHDTEMHTRFEDSVGMVSDWRKRGPVYEVPYRTLWSPAVKNLITAGRCTSVTDSMWDIMRVIPCCAVTGQAAGTAAAMTNDFSALDVFQLQTQLQRDGVVLHESEI